MKKVVLAYSGGLDTSVILKWLQDTYNCEVVTFTADLGQVRQRVNSGVECVVGHAVGGIKCFTASSAETLNECVAVVPVLSCWQQWVLARKSRSSSCACRCTHGPPTNPSSSSGGNCPIQAQLESSLANAWLQCVHERSSNWGCGHQLFTSSLPWFFRLCLVQQPTRRHFLLPPVFVCIYVSIKPQHNNNNQGEELEPARAKAEQMGVKDIFIDDLREEFVRDYVFPMFRANALYEGVYLLGTSIARWVGSGWGLCAGRSAGSSVFSQRMCRCSREH